MRTPTQAHHEPTGARGNAIGLPVLMLLALAVSVASAAVDNAAPGRAGARVELRGLCDSAMLACGAIDIRPAASGSARAASPACRVAGAARWRPDAPSPCERVGLRETQLDLPPPSAA